MVDATRGSSSKPSPGRPARGSSTGVPLMVLFDLLGRRWTLTCLWSLREGPRTFREIRAVDERISPSTLNTRLAELREVHLIERADRGYALTEWGLELLELGAPMSEWSQRWSEMLQSERTDPS